MARRTNMILGRGRDNRLSRLMGLKDRENLRSSLLENWQPPSIDFELLEERSDARINLPAREDIQGAFEALVASQIVDVASAQSDTSSRVLDATNPELIPNRDFEGLVRKVVSRADKLREAVDELVEFDLELAFPPRDTRASDELPSKMRYMIEDEFDCLDPVFRPDDSDFLEYFSFRRTLDYLGNFKDKNQRFNNLYGKRWTEETDHDNFEYLVRRVVVALRKNGFSMALTVPTDVSPDYESPCVSVLMSMQECWNAALALEIDKNLYAPRALTYRQMLYLASKVLESIEQLQEVLFHLRMRRS